MDVQEDEDSDSDVEQQMEKFKTQKEQQDKNKAKQSMHDTAKKRAISAKYQLGSQSKAALPKYSNLKSESSMKTNVLEALKEENKRIGTDEVEKRMKADTKKSRPFSNITAREKKISSKTRKPQVNTKFIDSKVNYQIDDTSSNTDFERQEHTAEENSAPVEYPRGSDQLLDAQMRKTTIIKKIEKLSDTQRQQLFFLLDQMEKGETIDKIDLKFLSPKPAMVKSTKQSTEEKTYLKFMSERSQKNELRICVLSTWGHVQVKDLTDLELLQPTGEKISLVPADIIVKSGNKILSESSKLTSNTHKGLEVNIYYPSKVKLGAIRFGNSDKTALDNMKGIKEIEVLVNGETKWGGILQRSESRDSSDYSVVVKLDPYSIVPPLHPKTKRTEYSDKQASITKEEEKVRKSAKVEKKGFLSRMEEAKSEAQLYSDQKSEFGADDSASSMPIWFKGKKQKDSSTDVSKGDISSDIHLPDISGSKSKGGLSRRQAAKLEPSRSETQHTQKHVSDKISEEMKLPSRRRAQESKSKLDSVEDTTKPTSRHLHGDKRPSKLDEKDGELIKGLDSLEYFEVTNLGRIGANNRRDQLSKSTKPTRNPIKATHYLDIDNETVFGTDKIENEHITTKVPSSVKGKPVDIFAGYGDILDKIKEEEKLANTNNDSDEEFEIQKQELEDKQTFETLVEDFENSDFWIPKMPIGKTLVLSILSTWGDNHYVGLSGIEIFDNEGNLVKINPENIMANPPDINILPGNTNDPRTVDKLVDTH